MSLTYQERALEARDRAGALAARSATLGRMGGTTRSARERGHWMFEDRPVPPEAEATDERSCRALLDQLSRAGLLSCVVPAPYGGPSERVEVSSLCAIREELAYADGMLDLLFVMQGLGSFPIALAGSPALRSECLPKVASGDIVAALALTEPEAGSDVASIRTTAKRHGEVYVLDGLKSFISNAPFADIFTLFARTGPNGGKEGLTAFLLRRGLPGLETHADVELIAPHPIGTIELSGVRVPVADRIGGEGDGFAIAMATLDRFRTTVGAAAVGFARRALDEALAFARARVQFGRPIAEFEGIQFKLADMATQLEAARLLVGHAAAQFDRRESPHEASGPAGAASHPLSPIGEDASRAASMAKLFATEAAAEIVDEAVQIHGGRGLVRGSVVERLYREVRALRIYEGTSEIQRTIIGSRLLRGSA